MQQLYDVCLPFLTSVMGLVGSLGVIPPIWTVLLAGGLLQRSDGDRQLCWLICATLQDGRLPLHVQWLQMLSSVRFAPALLVL